MSCNVGISSDDLLLGAQIGALLEFEITKGARERKVAVDSAVVDEAARSAYSCFLACLRIRRRDI